MNTAPRLLAMLPWGPENAFAAVIAMLLLGLLVIFTRGRSFGAIGAFIAVLCGCVAAAFEGGFFSPGSILGSCLLGACLGGVARVYWQKAQTGASTPDNTASPSPTERQRDPLYWLSAFGVAGTSAGLSIGVLCTPEDGWMLATVVGGALGALLGLLCIAIPKLKPVAELLIIVVLSGGIGAIFGWKIVWPEVDGLRSTSLRGYDKDWLLETTMLSTTGLAAFVGFVSWAVTCLVKRSSAARARQ